MTGTVVVIHSQADFQRSLQESKAWGGKGVVVDFYADWCGPCKMMAPMFEEMARQHPNIVFLKVNVDECQDVARVEQVSALPTFKAYFAGSVVGEVVGASPQKIAALIADVTAKMEAASAGTGRRLGGGEGQQPQGAVPAADSADEVALRRERVARAAEARLAQA